MVAIEQSRKSSGSRRGISQYVDLDWLKILIEFVIKPFFVEFVFKPFVRYIYRRLFKTLRFVAWEINGKIRSTKPKISLTITEDTDAVAIFKLGIVAPFWITYYMFKLKAQSISAKVVLILGTKLRGFYHFLLKSSFFSLNKY